MSGSDSDSSGISTSRDGTIHREKRKRREKEEADREAGEVVDATIDEEPTLPHDDQVTLRTDPTSKNHQKKQKVDEDVFKFEISKGRGKRFSKWLGKGLEDSEGRKLDLVTLRRLKRNPTSSKFHLWTIACISVLCW